MNDTDLGRNTVGFGLSVAVTCIFNSLLVLLKEMNEHTVLAWMKKVTVHHWVTHGIIDLLLFLVLGFILSRANGGKGIRVPVNTLIAIITISVVAGWVIIAAFNLMGAD